MDLPGRLLGSELSSRSGILSYLLVPGVCRAIRGRLVGGIEREYIFAVVTIDVNRPGWKPKVVYFGVLRSPHR